MEEVRLGEASVALLPVVRGLPSAGETVREAIDTLKPEVVALSVSPEELDALRAWRGGKLEPDTVEDEVYVAGLSVWETPVMPPPCFTRAVEAATTRGIRLAAIDMDEEAYADAYTKWVSTMELILQGRLENRLLKKRFHVSTAEDFARAWDAEINRSAGFARLQREREAFMAGRLRELARDAPRVLAVVEVERVRGVLTALRG